MSRILTLQKKAMRIITFQSRNCHSSPLVSKLKLSDKVHLENVLLISKFINSLLPPVSNNWFTFCSNALNYDITSSAACKLFKPSNLCKKVNYSKYDSVHPPFCRGVEPPTKFLKMGGLTGPQLLEGGDFFRGVAIFT